VGFNIEAELDKFREIGVAVHTIEATLKSERHVSSLIKAAHEVTAGEFVMHMSSESLRNPESLSHMYEWGQVGDPNGKLWRHVLKGNGANRSAFFEFKASRKTVPVDPALQSVGVRKIHVFVWKAMVLENGLPVKISPKLAKYLVFVAKKQTSNATSSGTGFVKNGIVYFKGTISIARAGNERINGAFTREWTQWWASGEPELAIRKHLTKPALDAMEKTFAEKVSSFSKLKEKDKKIGITVLVPDRLMEAKFQETLQKNYIAAAASRRSLMEDG
jgi:hypothetical protein